MAYTLIKTSRSFTLKDGEKSLCVMGINLEGRMYLNYLVTGQGFYDHFFYQPVRFDMTELIKVVRDSVSTSVKEDPLFKNRKQIERYMVLFEQLVAEETV